MMPNVTRGDRMGGLLVYLVGPGKANEHSEPHLVAGDIALLTWYGDNELDRNSALAIARHVDRPRKAYGVEVKGGHVWHCSLSLSAEEGLLTDERWQAIAEDFVTAMGFDDNQGTKAACRWAAVRHGVSQNGNDHIHLAINLVREDGTKASTHKDFKTAQTAARALEVKYGLQRLESAAVGRATRGFKPAEREAQARARAQAKYANPRSASARSAQRVGAVAPTWEQLSGVERQRRIAAELRADQPRFELARKVRAASVASRDEAEFVRRMRRSGLLVRARFAEGTTDVVTGYSVAERPRHGERPIWYGGGHLSRDLTLPRLRHGWEDSPTRAGAAAAEWTAARRGRRVVAPGREVRQPDPMAWAQQDRELRELVDRLRDVPLDDRASWATVARQAAGALAAWSNAVEEVPGDLAAAADVLSRSAQTHRHEPAPTWLRTTPINGLAMLAASASRGGQGPVGQAAMIRSLLRLTQAVYDHSVAAGQLQHARLLAQDTRARLVRVHDLQRAHAATGRAQGEQAASSTSSAGTALADRTVQSYADPEGGSPLDPETQAVLDHLNAVRTARAQSLSGPSPRGPGASTPGSGAAPGRSPIATPLESQRRPQPTTPAASSGPER